MITPDQIAKCGSESAHQKALFCYLAVAIKHGFDAADYFADNGSFKSKDVALFSEDKSIPELKWIHHIPNGGARDKVSAANLKLEGVKKGIADLFWPFEQKRFCGLSGLYIEMKKPDEEPKTPTSKGGLSDEQIEFRDFVLSQNYEWHVCYSWREAADVIKNYYLGV
jgi:hypothetical protein